MNRIRKPKVMYVPVPLVKLIKIRAALGLKEAVYRQPYLDSPYITTLANHKLPVRVTVKTLVKKANNVIIWEATWP